MRRPPIAISTLTFAVVAATAYLWISGLRETVDDIALIPPPAAPPEGELQASADQEAVFKRAFWRRPAADDYINNALLSEWQQDDSGVSRWQWFIEVEPSPDLKEWLQQGNPFSLAKKITTQLPAGATAAPAWFPTTARGFEIYQSADARTSLLFSLEENLLFATASGHGFAKGAAEPTRPVVEIDTSGRLPLTPPPNQPES